MNEWMRLGFDESNKTRVEKRRSSFFFIRVEFDRLSNRNWKEAFAQTLPNAQSVNISEAFHFSSKSSHRFSLLSILSSYAKDGLLVIRIRITHKNQFASFFFLRLLLFMSLLFFFSIHYHDSNAYNGVVLINRLVRMKRFQFLIFSSCFFSLRTPPTPITLAMLGCIHMFMAPSRAIPVHPSFLDCRWEH